MGRKSVAEKIYELVEEEYAEESGTWRARITFAIGGVAVGLWLWFVG